VNENLILKEPERPAGSSGWKTNTVAALSIVSGLAGSFFGVFDASTAVTLIVIGLAAFGLRDAIARVIANQLAQAAEQAGKKTRQRSQP
jgi:hypothetical protein